MIVQLKKYADPARYNVSLSESEPGTPLPPSSLHALLKANGSVPGLVVTDHQRGYTNR